MPKQTKQVIEQVLTLSSISDLLDRKLDQKLDERFGEFEVKLDKKFDAIDTKFDAIDKKFDAIDTKFNAIDTKFNAIDQRFDKIDQRFDKIEGRLGDVEGTLDRTIKAVVDLKQDMEIVKNYLTTEVPTKAEVNTLIEGLATKEDVRAIMNHLDRGAFRDQKFDQEQTMHSYRLREHTDQLEEHTKEIKALQLTTA